MKKTAQLTLLALLAAAASANAATVTYDANGLGSRGDFGDTINWVGDALPLSTDDVVLEAGRRFGLGDGDTFTINSLDDLAGGFSSSITDGQINVTNNVTLNQGLVLVGSTANLTYGGAMAADALEFVNGGGPSKLVGADLTTVAGGFLNFRWFAAATAGSTTAIADLSGSLTLGTGTTLEVSLEGGIAGNALTEGAYFLIASDNIAGSISSLTLSGFTTEQGNFSSLSIVGTGDAALQGLYLTVIPEPGTYALLAGCFALASVMIRRRR